MLLYLLVALGMVTTFQKTKCKKLLIITMERIKLLEKRRQARVRQLYRDVIELLLLKKEHKVDSLLVRIWKELCLFSVYAVIAEYCASVQINLKEIAAQRECPSGLEEPLSGLCFAASCCADLPELQELREIFAMKYGKQIVCSGQDLEPNCHVNHQLLDCLYSKDPSEAQKQEGLLDIITKYNVIQGHGQDTWHLYLCDYVSTEGSADLNDCNKLKEGVGFKVEVLEAQRQFEHSELQDVDVVQEPNLIRIISKQDLVSMELGNEITNRKRTIEGSKLCRSALKRFNSKSRFELNEGKEGEENGAKEHEQQSAEKEPDFVVCSDAVQKLVSEKRKGQKICAVVQVVDVTAHMNKKMMSCEDLGIVRFAKQPLRVQPRQCPWPPLSPPKRAPPPPSSLRVISMASFHYGKQLHANASLPCHCSTIANDTYIEPYGSHVHPRLPKYEDLIAYFTALKG